MGAGAEILAVLAELTAELAEVRQQLDRIESRQAMDPRAASARAAIDRQTATRRRLEQTDRWISEHVPDLVHDDGTVDEFAIWAVSHLRSHGQDVTPETVRRVHAARIAALPGAAAA